MAEKKNIVILTHGCSGSSVFAALLGRAGYWLGDETIRKPDYDTHENAELVALNQRLLGALTSGIDHTRRFHDEDVPRIVQAAAHLDMQPYRDFLDRSAAHSPWLWKDPRLTWTIRVWAKVLDLERTAFLILTRDDLQAWISSNQRRHIQSLRFTREYNGAITRSNRRFVDGKGLPCLALSFEDLLLEPARTLDRLNESFGLELTEADVRAVCQSPLHRKNRGWKDFVLAALIYAKNHGQRDARTRAA